MSKLNDVAEGMKAHLQNIPALAGIDIIVTRQKNIESELALACAKASGAAIAILYGGGNNAQNGAKALRIDRTFAVAISTMPFLNGGNAQKKMDELIEIVTEGLHGWKRSESHPCKWAMRYQADDEVPDDNFFIFEVQFRMII